MFCYYFLCCSILSSLGHGTGRATLFITFYGTFMTVAQDAHKSFFLQQPKSPKKQTTRFYFQLWKLCITSFQPSFFFSHKSNQMCRLFHCKTFSIWGKRHAQQTMTYATSCCNLWAMLPGLNELLFVSLTQSSSSLLTNRNISDGNPLVEKNGNSDGWYAICNVWHECKV